MSIFFSVIDELYQFAVDAILTLFGARRTVERSPDYLSILDPAIDEKIEAINDARQNEVASAAAAAVETASGDSAVSDFSSTNELINGAERELSIVGDKNTVMYAGGTELPLYKNPTKEFDTIITKLSYGTMVMVLEQKGRWARVVHHDMTGWVLREDLVDRAAHVYPHFVIGEQNNVDDLNTIRLRAIIDDEFGAAAADLSLQASEYTTYRLHRKGLRIQWPTTRPRVPGSWHALLKGKPGIHIGITPKTGAIMEYMINDNMGHVAYVEAVFPNETVTISETNYPDGGIYNERVITAEEWRELKPVFIQVSQ